jgi:hypothetical protein
VWEAGHHYVYQIQRGKSIYGHHVAHLGVKHHHWTIAGVVLQLSMLQAVCEHLTRGLCHLVSRYDCCIKFLYNFSNFLDAGKSKGMLVQTSVPRHPLLVRERFRKFFIVNAFGPGWYRASCARLRADDAVCRSLCVVYESILKQHVCAAGRDENDTYWRPATASLLARSSPVRLVADLVNFEPLGGRAVELDAGVSCTDLSHKRTLCCGHYRKI